MNMKKKLRRAFTNATPDVLNGILQECTSPQETREMVTAPPQKQPRRSWEVLSTAAAAALLLCVVGVGILFLGNPDSFGLSNSTDPSTDPTTTGLETYVDFTDLIRRAWAIVDPEETNNEEANTSRLTEQDGTALFHLEISSGGYCYGFDYNARTGQLKNLEVIICDCIKDGYISEGVAAQIALLDVSLSNPNVEWTLLEPELNEAIRCYIITLSHPMLAYSEIRFVDCVNGQFVEDFNWISTCFSATGSWYNMALTCSYTSPTELSLARFFYNGFSDESREPTEDELALYGDTPLEMDLIRLPVKKMNSVLTRYFGITLDDMDGSCFEGLIWLERTGCYYMIHNDALSVEGFTIVGRTITSDGEITVQYTVDGSEDVYDLVVTSQDVDYRILSNSVYRASGDTAEDPTSPADGNIGTELAISTALEYLGFAEGEVADLTCEFDGESYYIVTFTARQKRHFITVGAFNPNVEAYSFEYLADPISYDDARMDTSDYLPHDTMKITTIFPQYISILRPQKVSGAKETGSTLKPERWFRIPGCKLRLRQHTNTHRARFSTRPDYSVYAQLIPDLAAAAAAAARSPS